MNKTADVEGPVRSRLNEICTERYRGNEAEMARATDIPRPTLHNILSGKTQKIELKQIVAVVTKTGVLLDWLILGIGPKFRTEHADARPAITRIIERSIQPGTEPEGVGAQTYPGVAFEVLGKDVLAFDFVVSGQAERLRIPINPKVEPEKDAM